VYVWIGNYYGKPAWKHQTQNYWLYYSRFGASSPSTYYWYIDDELKGEHGTYDYNFYHAMQQAVLLPAGQHTDPAQALFLLSTTPISHLQMELHMVQEIPMEALQIIQ
jgi:hypothetical protein